MILETLLALGALGVFLIPLLIGLGTLYAIYKLLHGDDNGDGHIAHLDHHDHEIDTKPSPLLGVVHPKHKDKDK
jgi:hypothetical protein